MSWKEAQGSFIGALSRLESWAKLASIVVSAIGIVAALNGVFNFSSRVPFWIIVAVLCGLLAIHRPQGVDFSVLGTNGGKTTPPKSEPRWWWGTIAALVALTFDVTLHYSLPKSIAEVKGPYFGMGDARDLGGSILDSDRLPTARYPVASVRDVTPDLPATDANSDLTDWLTEPKEKWPSLLRSRGRIYVDNLDMRGPIDQDSARSLYWGPLFEHFGFRIRKNPKVAEVIVVNVQVTVHKFISCLTPPAPAGPERHRDIIVVELERLTDKPLPWKFGAKYLLDDPKGQLVTPWNRATVSIVDDFEHTMLVKVAAKDVGIYVYTADLFIKDGISGRELPPIPLVSKPRSVFFEIGRNASANETRNFWSHIRTIVPEGDPLHMHGPGSLTAPPAPFDSGIPAPPTPPQ